MSFLQKVKTSTLVQVAAGTFLLGSTGLYLAQKSMQGKVRGLPHYKESLEIIAEHKQAREVLGPPIQLGQVDLSDRLHNYVDKRTSMLRVPVTGSLDCGHMDVYALRNTTSDSFKTSKLRLQLNGVSMPHLLITTHSLSNKGCKLRKEGFDLPAELYLETIIFCSKHSPAPCSCDDLQSKSSPISVVNKLEKYGWKVVSCYSYATDNQKHAWVLYKEKDPEKEPLFSNLT